MKVIGMIPARYASSRFEGKALALLGGRPLVQHVYERSSQAERLDDVFIATDDARIADAVRSFGGNAVMTSATHTSGTDRIAEAASRMDVDVVVNIQGDEPFISPRAIDQAVEPFERQSDLEMTTLMQPISEESTRNDPNVVKVVVDCDGYALYFSRSLIPHPRRRQAVRAYQHIGLYAYRKEFLLRFASLPPGRLEQAEALEQLRALEHQHRILVLEAEEYSGIGVDTPEDLEKANRLLCEQPLKSRSLPWVP